MTSAASASPLMVAALYVEKGGAYYGLSGVDPWDEERDAERALLIIGEALAGDAE